MTRRKLLFRIAGLAAAAALIAGAGIRQPAAVHATGMEGFTFLQPGFTQTLWGTNPGFLGGVAFATNGDVLADTCAFAGSPLIDYSQTSTTLLNGSTLHNHTSLPSNAGCGLTNHPNGTLYTNTNAGVVNLNAATGAVIKGPVGTGGNALGIATDPLAPNNLIYVGSSFDLFSIDAALTASSSFSTADTGNFKDQIAWSPDGQFLFISNRTAPFKLQIVSRTGTLVQNVLMPNEPDGIAFHATAPQFVVTDNTDGTMTRFDFPANNFAMPPVLTPFATGGFRGDMSAVGANGCLYVTQAGTRYANATVTGENSIVQICGGFAPPPGVGPPPCVEKDGNGDIKDENSAKHVLDNKDVKINVDLDDNEQCEEKDQEENGDDKDNDQQQVDTHDNRDGSDFHANRIDSTEFTQQGKKLTVLGAGLHNGKAVTFVMVAIDNGSAIPGFFSLQLSDGYNVAGSLIDGVISLNN